MSKSSSDVDRTMLKKEPQYMLKSKSMAKQSINPTILGISGIRIKQDPPTVL